MNKSVTQGNSGSPKKKALPNKRPMAMRKCPKSAPRASRSLKPRCCNWDVEAALRMLQNNLDDDIAIDWKQLIVYGESGRAARNWKEYHRIVKELKKLQPDQTLCIQSWKPVYIAHLAYIDTHFCKLAREGTFPRFRCSLFNGRSFLGF